MKNSLLFLFISSYSFGQSSIDIKSLTQPIPSYSQFEKVYVHTDRDYYTAGGDIFFKVYLTNEQLLQSTTKSKIVYVDLISSDKQIIDSKTIAINNGNGIGDFKITSKFKSGNYIIRAYTHFMKNFDNAFFFRKSIYIHGVTSFSKESISNSDALDIQFFPEGGDLITGLKSKIALKAVNASGFGIQLIGKIVNTENQELLPIQTNEKGFGAFKLEPKLNQSYFFITQHNGKTIKKQLPIALPKGAVIACNIVDSEKLNIQISLNDKSFGNGFIIGHAKGKIFLEELVKYKDLSTFNLDVETIPSGVLHFTLFDQTGQPRAERLVFNHFGINNFNVDISADKKTYGKREKVQLKLDFYDDEGEYLPADLSLSVIHNVLSKNNLNKEDIQSYLLLSSDIKGFIEEPTFYFINEETTTRQALDLLLMTQGWRRFSWKDIKENQVKQYNFQPERSLSLSGTTNKKDNPEKPVKTVGYLSELSTSLSMIEFESSTDGRFYIDGLQTKNSVDMVLQAAALDKKQQKVKKGNLSLKGNRDLLITIDKKTVLPVGEYELFGTNKSKPEAINLGNLENIKYDNDLPYDELSIDLDIIEVTAKKIDKIIKYYEDGMLYSRPDTRIKMEFVTDPNKYKNIHEVLNGRVTGMLKSGDEVIIRGRQTGLSQNIPISNAARFMVNGSFVSQGYAEAINPNNIAFIDILKSLHQLTPFGEMGANGLIMIYLVPPEERERARKNKEVNGLLNFTFNGYDEAREFYVPKYDIPNNTNNTIDNRITLNWIPNIQSNELGETLIEFYTSDQLGTYDVLLEGISENGVPIIAKSKIIIR